MNEVSLMDERGPQQNEHIRINGKGAGELEKQHSHLLIQLQTND